MMARTMPRTVKKHPPMEKIAGTLLAIREDENRMSELACYHRATKAFSIQTIQP